MLDLLVSLTLATLALPATDHAVAGGAAVPAPVAAAEEDRKLTAVLVEDHAAPYWALSLDAAWHAYTTGAMTIDEVEPGHFAISYDGGVLDVLIQDDGI